MENKKLSIVRLFLVLIITAVLLLLGINYVVKAITDIYAFSTTRGHDNTWVAPYVDVAIKPTAFFEGYDSPQLPNVVIGSVVATPFDSCKPSWGAHYGLEAAARALDLDRRLVRFKERGGTTMVSFGGDPRAELASVCEDLDALADAYTTTLSRYGNFADFVLHDDVLANQAVNQRRTAAIQRLQDQNENLTIWLTLPATPQGLTEGALNMLETIFGANVELAGVNVMPMISNNPSPSQMSALDVNTRSLVKATAQLSQLYNRYGQLKDEVEIWHHMGITPMIGQNQSSEEVFTLDDAADLIDFLYDKNVGRISFWSINRDIPCGVNSETTRVSNTCSGVDQETLEFSRLFAKGFPKSALAKTQKDLQNPLLPPSEKEGVRPSIVSTDPDKNPYPLWRQQRDYSEGDKIVWQGRVYQAKWWSKAHQPDAPAKNAWDSPWRFLGPVLVSDQNAITTESPRSEGRTMWATERVFSTQDEVLHDKKVYRAGWRTQGEKPEQIPERPYDHPWVFLGTLDCDGNSCEDSGIGAQLIVDYQGLTNVNIEIRENDGIAGMAGKLIHTFSNQSGQKTYKVIRESYDITFRKASSELILDAVDCSEGTCTTGSIAATLSVDYEGLNDINMEIRKQDGVAQMAGNIVELRQRQSGQKTYKVLRNQYDLVFKNASSTHIVDAVDCSNAICSAGDIAATLSVDFKNLTDISMEIRGDDGLPNSTGGLVQLHSNQSGHKTFDVLLSRYDLVFKKGAAQLIVDKVNCSQTRCNAGAIVSELLVNIGNTSTTVEVRVDDGQDDSTGGLVETYEEQVGAQRYAVLRGRYDITMQDDDWFLIEDAIDCSKSECQLQRQSNNGEMISPEIEQLEQELAHLKEQFTDNYPDVVTIRKRIEELRGEG